MEGHCLTGRLKNTRNFHYRNKKANKKICERSLGKTYLQCLPASSPDGLNPSAQAPPIPMSSSRLWEEHNSFPEVAAVHRFTEFISICVRCVPERITQLQKQRNTEVQLTMYAFLACNERDGFLLFVASFHYSWWKNADAFTLLMLAKSIQSPKIFLTLLIGCFLVQFLLNKFPWERIIWSTQLE